METGHDWLGGQACPYKASRSYFLESGRTVLGSSMGAPVSAG